MIAKVQESPYLNLTDLKVGETYTRLCYVMNVKAGISVLGNGYYTFYLKDMNANVIPARLFNVDGFTGSGLDAISFRGKPAMVTFETQVFNNNLSLVITGIKMHNGAFDYSIFLGKIESKEDLVKKIFEKYEVPYEIPTTFKTMSIQELYSGRTGGMMRLFVSTVRASLNYADLVNFKDLLVVIQESFLFYAQYLAEKSKVSLIDAKTVYSLLHTVFMRNAMSDNLSAIIDACYALADEGDPKHYYSVMIKRLVTTELENADMAMKVRTMPAGMPISINNKIVLNY